MYAEEGKYQQQQQQQECHINERGIYIKVFDKAYGFIQVGICFIVIHQKCAFYISQIHFIRFYPYINCQNI